MDITNDIGWRKRWLTKLMKFCCLDLDYPIDSIKKATFRLTYGKTHRGWAELHSHTIVIAINPLGIYPVPAEGPRGLPELVQTDVLELLVGITAHEIAHLARWDSFARDWKRLGKRDSKRELETERLARKVLTAFRHDRERLLDAWGESGRGMLHWDVIWRISCRRCGLTGITYDSGFVPERRHCPNCFPSWQAANAAGEFLTYERMPPPRRGSSV
jgi:hypothetical protein